MTGKDMEQGIFYGVGTGPGEAELMTLKACRIIRECEVLVMPALGSECRAYNIVKQAIPELDDKEILDCSFPMNMNKEEREAVHDQTAGRIVGFCREGKNVAFITLGDPCVYSTYTYVARLVSQQGIKTRFINGVTSFQAAAAALDIDLVLQDEMLHVIPGCADPVEALKLPGTKI
ncbi:MAG: precorrin-2 C(20)-methyltransferase, partial [Lachnospiraceae bacterium]|nr:precorrin-2 C(20)-methyltransferase [Lachnospiraceae bacterium]